MIYGEIKKEWGGWMDGRNTVVNVKMNYLHEPD